MTRWGATGTNLKIQASYVLAERRDDNPAFVGPGGAGDVWTFEAVLSKWNHRQLLMNILQKDGRWHSRIILAILRG